MDVGFFFYMGSNFYIKILEKFSEVMPLHSSSTLLEGHVL